MTTNEQAKNKIMNTLRDLVLIKHNDRPKTGDQIASIDYSVDQLNNERFRLEGLSLTATYSDIASNIGDAESDLNDIVEDREDLADALVTASKILGSIRAVLTLI
ncbi:hypothetical protein [Roseobacter sp. MH60115]|uniref:hypothetical protein n=1 Tax=Roseobacter sp. MH60115 TaxID=2785324 RepID=UPI0018A2872A|nr:hypothetical protein [Roseobacter sp. MH60115]